jgi:uncharacterized protein
VRRSLVWVVAAVLAAAGAARGQSVVPANQGITVWATGTAKAKATQVEVVATLTSESEIANDAITKYRDAKRRALEAVGKLGVDGLTVEETGMSMGNVIPQQQLQMMMNGQAANVKASFQVTERLRLTLKGIDKLEPVPLADTLVKIMDGGKDAGLLIGEKPPSNYYEYNNMMNRGGQQTAVLFKLADADAVKQKAYEAAVADAKAKAARLAQLSGVKLGPVTSITEGPVSPTNPFPRPGVTDSDPSSAIFGEIPVTVVLTVQFGIEK